MLLQSFIYVKDFLLPKRCMCCLEIIKENAHICFTCWPKLNFITEPHCLRCGTPFHYKIDNEMVCASCLRQSNSVDQYRSVFTYSDIVKDMLLRFKHGDHTYMTPIFAQWMKQKLTHFELDQTSLFVPVPLHWKRLFKRQYNQAALLTKYTAQLAKYDYCIDLLKRVRHTKPQGHFTKDSRHKNLANAIALNERYLNQIKNKTVVLFDDVIASGATVNECARILKKAQVKRVYVLTIAKTVFNN